MRTRVEIYKYIYMHFTMLFMKASYTIICFEKELIEFRFSCVELILCMYFFCALSFFGLYIVDYQFNTYLKRNKFLYCVISVKFEYNNIRRLSK
jgi:hypothetical protein